QTCALPIWLRLLPRLRLRLGVIEPERDPVGVVLADLQLTLQEVDITVVELLRRVGEIVSRGHGAAGQLAPPAEDESAADGDQPETDRATDEQQCHHEFHGPPLSVRCGLVPPA